MFIYGTPDNYRLSQKEAFLLVKCIRRYV